MSIQTICIGVVGILFGLAVAFAGYRLFLILLPIWGFFAGFAIGAQALSLLFGDGFLATVTGWVVGFIVGAIFAVLSYLFYLVGVAIIAGSIGYALGAGIVFAISANWNILAFLVGIVAAVIVAAAVLLLNVQKWVIILITAVGGAGAAIAGVMLMFGVVDMNAIGNNSVLDAFKVNWIWALIGLALAVAGFIAQSRTTTDFTLEAPPNRM